MLRPLTPLTLLAAVAALPSPASAVTFPYCATQLAAATYAVCSTDNVPPVRGFRVLRTAHVAVEAGSVRATLTCGFGTGAPHDEAVVGAGGSVTLHVAETAEGSCRVELRALTTVAAATATSTFSYALDWPPA